MRRITIVPLVLLVTALMTAGCAQQPNAPAGAQPASFAPVGPVPGYGNPPRIQSNPYAHDRLAMTQGRQLFLWFNCAGCHGGHGGGGMGPSLRDPVWLYGDSDAEIFNSIAEGRGKGMPAWGLKLPEQQIWQLVAYIKSMRTPDEPDAPEQ